MPVHLWQSLSWPAFRALPADRLVAVLPLGALEAHGPHLPLGTDIVIARAMAYAGAARLARRGFEAVLLPVIPVSPAPFAASFAGTVDLAPAATTDVVSGIARSVVRHGGRATVIANAHHDPAHVAALRAAVDRSEGEQPGTLIFPDLTRRRWAARLTEEFRSGACHAGRYEGSVVLAAEPQQVDVERMRALPDNPRSLVEAIARGDRTFAEAGGPDAYFGWPAAASADEGREIITRLATILEEAVLEVLGPLQPEATHRREEERSTMPTATPLEIVNPAWMDRPRGFSHGTIAPAGWRTLSVAGQTAITEAGAGGDLSFAAQFDVALGKVLDVVRAAGGVPSHVGRMTIYVTTLQAYRESRPVLAEIWTKHMGRHYPAMALVEVSGLVDGGATVEIQADAALPPRGRDH